jgi:hypothetical protein
MFQYGILGWFLMFKTKDLLESKIYYPLAFKYLISNLHAISSIILSIILIWNPQEQTEKILVSSMMGYFIADMYNIINSTNSNYYDMYIHHVLCAICLYYVSDILPWNNNHLPNFLAKTTLLEISTPYLNTYKTYKHPVAGIFLLITFFVFRILWLTHIYSHVVFNVPDSYLRPAAKKALLVFVLLNYYWFTKMVMIAYRKTNEF